jgi:hypothetical protein
MLQVYNALFETALRLGREYGPPVAVLVFVGCGVALRVLARVLPRGGQRRAERRGRRQAQKKPHKRKSRLPRG